MFDKDSAIHDLVNRQMVKILLEIFNLWIFFETEWNIHITRTLVIIGQSKYKNSGTASCISQSWRLTDYLNVYSMCSNEISSTVLVKLVDVYDTITTATKFSFCSWTRNISSLLTVGTSGPLGWYALVTLLPAWSSRGLCRVCLCDHFCFRWDV